MKRIFTLLLSLFFLSLGKTFSQSCVALGCANSFTGITTDGTLASQPINFAPASGCFVTETYKQVFWQFFYSPTGGDFTQTFTPTTPSDNLDIYWAVYLIPFGQTPASVHCPVDPTGWIEIKCSTILGPGNPKGPGIDGQATTDPGRYYAVAVIVYQGLDNGGLASYGFDIGNPQLNGIDFDATNCPAIILPVKISSFGATATNNCTVNLDWTAEAETDFKSYEVQYSSDGTQFKTIATLPAAENSGAPQKYSYADANAGQGNGFYRLKLMDIDGKFEYSKIVATKLDCAKSLFTVYPNPVTDILTINSTHSQNESATVRLFDDNGRLIYNHNLVEGKNTINAHQFPKGIYLLQLMRGNEVQNVKIIK